MDKQIFTVSVIGIGSIAQKVHLPIIKSFRNNLKLDLLIDPFLDENELKKIATIYNCRYSRNIKDVNSDLSVIATPISSHFEIAYHLLNKCKYLLIEKPVTYTLEDINKLIDMIKSNKEKRIFVGHVRRFYKNANIARKIISNNILGDIEEVKIYEGNLYGWNRKFSTNNVEIMAIDNGVLFDVGSHSIDLLTFIFSDILNAVLVEKSIVDKIDLFSNILFRGLVSIKTQNRPFNFIAAFSNTTALNNGLIIKGAKANLFVPTNDSIRPKLISKLNKDMIELEINYNNSNPFYLMYDNILKSIYNKLESILDLENFILTTKILDDAFNNAVEGTIDWLD